MSPEFKYNCYKKSSTFLAISLNEKYRLALHEKNYHSHIYISQSSLFLHSPTQLIILNRKCTRKQTKWAPGLQNAKWFSIIHSQYSGYNLSNSKCDQFYGTHCTMHMYVPSSGIIHFKFWYDSQKNAQHLQLNWWRAYYTCWNFNTAGNISYCLNKWPIFSTLFNHIIAP